MRGYLKLIRPLNCGMSAVGCVLGSLVATADVTKLSVFLVAEAAAIAFIFTAAGNSLNDYYDRDVDSINRPERPIPSGQVAPRSALMLAAVLFAPTVPMSYLIGWELLTLVLINLGLMSSYEFVFKREGFRGNILISWLVASLFIFGGLAVYGGSLVALQRIFLLALLAFLATLGREVIKDIEDIAGDVGRWTLPMTMGERGAGRVASASLIAAVALSVVPVILKVLTVYYVFVVVVADAIFIYAALNAARKPATAQRAAKYAMLAALAAFLVGGFP